MNEKTTVTVVAKDGYTKSFKGDTAIIFMVDGAEAFLDGKVKKIGANTAWIGLDIPDSIFEDTIGSLINNLIENNFDDDPMKASYTLFTIAQKLEKKSDELAKKATPEQMNAFVEDSLHELFKAILKD